MVVLLSLGNEIAGQANPSVKVCTVLVINLSPFQTSFLWEGDL